MKCEIDKMAYSSEGFYEPYAKYLKLPEVRAAHDRIFSLFELIVSTGIQVVDLGCATCEFGEWLQHSLSFKSYAGIDLHEACNVDRGPLKILTGDYRDPEFDAVYKECNVFVSMFSTECHLSADEKYELYERLFSFPNMRFGLVSGFVYDHSPDEPKIQERIGFDVYQTVESPLAYRSDMFDELRYLERVPPGMFTDQFTEVWKVLVRR